MIPIREARRLRGITQRELGRLTEIQQATISRAEAGQPLTREQAERLARFFGFPWEENHFLYPERYASLNPAKAA